MYFRPRGRITDTYLLKFMQNETWLRACYSTLDEYASRVEMIHATMIFYELAFELRMFFGPQLILDVSSEK